MKNFIYFFTLIFISFSCKNNKKDIDINYDKEIYSPSYSQNFKISGIENSDNSLITIHNPWQGSQNVSMNLLIKRDSLFHHDSNTQILKGEAERIICMSSTHRAMLEALGAIDRIVGVSGKEYVSNPKIRENPFIPDIGYEGNIDYETIVSLNPDLIMLFSVNGASAMESKLKEFGIPFLYIGDYVEETPLGKAEWMIPIAEIIGKSHQGIEVFKNISKRYNTLKDSVAKHAKDNPTVMVNAPFLDSWFMPSTTSYVANIIHDAGGNYIYDKNTGNTSLPIDKEEAMMLIDKTDFWINIGNLKNYKEFETTFPDFISADCVKKRNLYNNNALTTPGGGNDCYESGAVNPDILLRDLIKIFHSELIDEEFTYYHQLK